MNKLRLVFALCFVCRTIWAANAVVSETLDFNTPGMVSWVDTTMQTAQKYTLVVDGVPFYMTSVQVRLDKLKAYCAFGIEQREKAIAVCVEHNFNTVSIPLHWREVEPEKNCFEWSVLDEYLSVCTKYGLKLEILWFSWSSGGTVQALNSSQLRTPDYVCSKSGTSEYKVINKTDPWTLDWYDDNLMEREKVVVDSIMKHIEIWDSEHDSPHTVIGIQLGNEPQGYGQEVGADRIMEYYSYVGRAIKESGYKVWTRLNCVSGKTMLHVNANENLKLSPEGSNIDFVGIDVYGTTCSKLLGDLGGQFKKVGTNYMMIMECGAEVADASHYIWAALRGGKAYSHYDFAGTDNHGLFDVEGGELVKHGTYVDDIANSNKILNMVNRDVAALAQGKGMYVYNYDGQTTGTEKGLDGIVYEPYMYNSHGLALKHSEKEYILATSARATFTIPELISVESVSAGYLDSNNNWVEEESLTLSAGRKIAVKEAKAIMIRVKEKEAVVPEGPITKFEPGKDWKDINGKVINAHGGCVVKDGEYYYWIGDKRIKNDCVGVSCYRSRDLLNWKDMGYAVELKGEQREDCQDFAKGRALYRPKIAYCENTGKWVLCVVWENDNKGDIGLVAFATSDKPYGPYELEEVKYTYKSRTRDQGLFKDDDGSLYYQACIDGNSNMWNSLMSSDYLSTTETAAVILPGAKYEAPALFRVDDTYFGLFSGCTGWNPNRSRFAYSQDILGEWKYQRVFTDNTGSGVEFCVDDSLSNTYSSQSAYVYKVDGDSKKLIYIGDRWNSSNLESSKTVWLPISMRSGIPTVRWYDSWDLSVFDDMYRFKRAATVNEGDEVMILERNSNRFLSRRIVGLCIDNDDDNVNLRFYIHKTDVPYTYTLEEKSTGKYLEAVFSSIRFKDANDSDAQKWFFRLQEDGTYIIKNVATGQCLTVSGATTRAGSGVYLDDDSNRQLQSFSICFDSRLYPEKEEAKIFTREYTNWVAEEMERQKQEVAITETLKDMDNGVKAVYNLVGMKMDTSNVSSLPRGVYIIVDNHGNSRKISVR